MAFYLEIRHHIESGQLVYRWLFSEFWCNAMVKLYVSMCIIQQYKLIILHSSRAKTQLILEHDSCVLHPFNLFIFRKCWMCLCFRDSPIVVQCICVTIAWHLRLPCNHSFKNTYKQTHKAQIRYFTCTFVQLCTNAPPKQKPLKVMYLHTYISMWDS